MTCNRACNGIKQGLERTFIFFLIISIKNPSKYFNLKTSPFLYIFLLFFFIYKKNNFEEISLIKWGFSQF